MNPIIEELKNEDGHYKIKRLSDSKIQLEYSVPLMAEQEASEMYPDGSVKVIGKIHLKIRYKIKENERRSSNELPTYYLIPIKDRFLQIISQNWKIKKKFISLQRNSSLLLVENHLIYGLYCGFIFNDKNWTKSWTRDKIINEIFNNESGNN